MADQPVSPGSSFFSNDSDRLESWKEVASYLRRDVRTVQRWEKREGLPVHRHLHDKLGTVYASKAELDRWWRDRAIGAEPDEPADTIEAAPLPSLPEPAVAHSTTKWRHVAIAAAALVLLALLIWQLPLRNPESHEPTFHRVALIDGAIARVSPDGRWLAYLAANSGALVLRDLHSGDESSLFDAHARPPLAWSKDSRQIAFLSQHEGPDGVAFELRSKDVSSGTERLWWRGIAARLVEPHDWLGTDRLLARVRLPGNQWQIALLTAGRPEREVIATLSSEIGTMQISPDGRFVAYSSLRNSDRDIFLRRLEPGSPEVRITDSPSREGFPVWTPDGGRLMFLRQRATAAALWAVRIAPDTGARVEEAFLRALPDSRNRLISLTAEGRLVFSHRVRNPRVFLVDVDPQSGRPLSTPRSSFDDETYDPVWARANGLGYRRTLPDSTTVFALRNVEADSERQYRLPRAYNVQFLVHAWGESHFTFFGADPQMRRGFFDYYPDSDQVLTRLLTEEDVRPPARWSPDGNELLYAVAPLPDGRFPVRIFNQRTGSTETRVLGATRPFAKWSPDGQRIAYTDRNCLWEVPRTGGSPRQLKCAPPSEIPVFAMPTVGSLSWAPDGGKIAWVVHNAADQRIDMWIVNVATGAHALLPGERGYRSWPADPAWLISPSRIAFRMEFKPEFEVWSLDNVTPK